MLFFCFCVISVSGFHHFLNPKLNLTWKLRQVSSKSIRCYYAQKTNNFNRGSCKCSSYIFKLSSLIFSLCNLSVQLSNQASCSTLLNARSALECHLITWNQLAQHDHHMVNHTLLQTLLPPSLNKWTIILFTMLNLML